VSDAPRNLRLDNPLLVRWEFASEERLATRNALTRQLIEGDNPEEFVFQAVAEVNPTDVLEVGAGAGEMAERIARELGANVLAIDSSERMVALTRETGVEAILGDVASLTFDDASYDVVVAGWVFYHVSNRDQAIAECARVLRPGGRLIAATLADENLGDLWDFLGAPQQRTLTFSTANGAAQLAKHFVNVEAREAHGVVVFPTPESVRRFVAADMTRAHVAANVPDFTEPVPARTHHTVFVAEKRA
jgi:ubiquinone/menaquinone biosynthesis C-methylase UbiE